MPPLVSSYRRHLSHLSVPHGSPLLRGISVIRPRRSSRTGLSRSHLYSNIIAWALRSSSTRTYSRPSSFSFPLVEPSPASFKKTSVRIVAMPKRKSSSNAAAGAAVEIDPGLIAQPTKRRSSQRGIKSEVNDDIGIGIVDGSQAAGASPSEVDLAGPRIDVVNGANINADTLLSDVKVTDDREVVKIPPKQKKAAGKAKTTPKKNAQDSPEGELIHDPEADVDEPAEEEEVKAALSRPPPVNSDYLPLPWKGRLGYACLNTYLRNSNPPIFCSRTCRIASIIENRHPLMDPTQPAHATKNRPDRDQPPDVARGQEYVESIGLANAGDLVKMLRWNDRYGIKFMRLSSEMFPFASHAEYGYKLAPFASKVLEDAGKVAAELGHRLTTHPGQFTQLGSPRKEVIEASIRDLDYHDEMLSLLKLPEQQNRDAVMILHMGGVFGDKEATLDRFRRNYARLSNSVKNRLVLENDDVSWSVHDLLPICEELNIPLVLDFHHHNIIFDSDKLREGTKDIMKLYPRIKATWDRKRITMKMHYSEPTAEAITPRQRRKHSARVKVLPPCPDDMDLMIEAKDKEQAVFELMRTFRLPSWDTFNDVIPFVREDDNKAFDAEMRKKEAAKNRKRAKKIKKGEDPLESAAEELEEEMASQPISQEDVGMGGSLRRVYWPEGMEEWLRPAKRVVKKKEDPEKVKKERVDDMDIDSVQTTPAKKGKITTTPKKTPAKKRAKKVAKEVLTPSTSDVDEDGDETVDFSAEEKAETEVVTSASKKRQSGRAKKRVSYLEDDDAE